jgi:glycosyltransferase involved in cell wall biosynthesis
MLSGKKVVVVMPAYNAEKTLLQTYNEIDRTVVDDIVLVDDCSRDGTVELAKKLGLHVVEHKKNRGYGGNQKSCYKKALELKADVVVMLHPDYQYTPKLIPAMAGMIASGVYDFVLGSRILGGGALRGGMPLYKYVSNRFITFFENVLTGMKLSEYHTGYRAFSKQVLEGLPLELNDDDFIFDNQMIIQAHFAGYRVGEISCPTKYFDDASSLNFSRSLKYGFCCLWVSIQFRLAKWGFCRFGFLKIPS